MGEYTYVSVKYNLLGLDQRLLDTIFSNCLKTKYICTKPRGVLNFFKLSLSFEVTFYDCNVGVLCCAHG